MSSRWMPARRIGGGNRPHGNLHAYRGEKPAHGGIVIFGDRKKDLGHCGNGGSVEEGKGGPFGPAGKKGGRSQRCDRERLSELLNERVREVQKSGGTANYLHVVMLAAMKLGDEILELREELGREKQRFEERSQGLLAVLDQALK